MKNTLEFSEVFFLLNYRKELQMIQIENINKSFDHKNVLTNVNLTIPNGCIYGIIGYSGAGKSTLVRIINALEKPDSGKVFINNTDLYSLDDKKIRNEKRKSE